MPFLSSVSAFVSGRGGSPPSCRHDTALQSDKLVADDPHRHERNPLYVGVFLTNAGLGLLASRLGFCVLFLASLVFYWRLLLREEAQMLATQGESYARFLERVPCLWPSLTPRLPASGRTPEWGQAFLGEVTIWALAVATLMYAVTLRAWITYAIVALALIGACSRRWRFQIHYKVIQTENNYEKEVFNGDIGTFESIDLIEHEVSIRFDNRLVNYDFGELDEVSLAYAVTIHKSQGSEFPAVVIPLATQHYVLLQRNLIYTGVTRGKKLVVLIGQKKALGMAVRNDRTQRRYSGLLECLRGPKGKENSTP